MFADVTHFNNNTNIVITDTIYGEVKSFTTKPDPRVIVFNPNLTYGTVTDVDGNAYNTIIIGNQEWMAQNLKVTKYQNGTQIQNTNTTNGGDWVFNTSGSWCYYDNDGSKDEVFGKLYNYFAVSDTNGLCPTGWRIPTLSDWDTLYSDKSIIGKVSKESGSAHWIGQNFMSMNSSNTGTNDNGLTIVPGGFRYGMSSSPRDDNGNIRQSEGPFSSFGNYGSYWSKDLALNSSVTDISGNGLVWGVYFKLDSDGLTKVEDQKEVGHSVRCVRNLSLVALPKIKTDTITDITFDSAISGGEVFVDGNLRVAKRGVCYSTTPSPTYTENNSTSDSLGFGKFTSVLTGLSANTTYYVRAYALRYTGQLVNMFADIHHINNNTNIVITDTIYGEVKSFTTKPDPRVIVFNPNLTYGSVTDVDGNAYNTIIIGNQEWMAENLKVTKYQNGENIDNIQDGNQWNATSQGAWVYYGNDSTSNAVFGKLYNYFAVSDTRNVCPTGWKVPSETDWATLEKTVGLTAEETSQSGFRGGENSLKLKETGNAHWLDQNDFMGGGSVTTNSSTNDAGFTGLPGGYRGTPNGDFGGLNNQGYFWGIPHLSARVLINHNGNIFKNVNDPEQFGMSVRCLKVYNSCEVIHVSESKTACTSFTWHGNTYHETGTYVDSLKTSVGCDSIITLNLTINQPSVSILNVTACGSYSWKDSTYSTSGSYTFKYINICIINDTLHSISSFDIRPFSTR